jgi:hypothetical protein
LYRKLLTERFFQENPYMEISAQRIVYSTLLSTRFEEAAAKIVMENIGIGDDRLERIAREKETILAQNDPGMIFQLMRKNLDVINRSVLIECTLAFEAEILPMVVEKLVRSDHDIFIDNAVRFLGRSKQDYSPLLLERYTEFRSPYVQSLLCIIIGIRGPEDTIPWMLDRFYEMKKFYPDENYDQGPLLALYELNARFYLY